MLECVCSGNRELKVDAAKICHCWEPIRGEGLSPGVGVQGWQQNPRMTQRLAGAGSSRVFYIPEANLAGWGCSLNQERRVWSRKGGSLGVFRGLGHGRLQVAG